MRRLIAFLALALHAACATAPPGIEGTRGFFWGLFDGAVAPFAFILSLFGDEIAITACRIPAAGTISASFWA